MRQADIVCALCLLMLAGLVAWESLALNIGWGINGPEGGFFPFWLALGLGVFGVKPVAAGSNVDSFAVAW